MSDGDLVHEDGSLVSKTRRGVSVELLELLDAFAQHASTIFADLSRAKGAPQAPAPTEPHQGHASSGASAAAAAERGTLRAWAALGEVDEQLAHELRRAKTHEANQRRIEELEGELGRYELAWRDEVEMLERERNCLAKFVDRGRRESDRIAKAKRAALTPSTVLAYARLLAPYTSAPPRSGVADAKPAAGLADLPLGALLPYPTEEVMRRGRLAFAQVGDLGETRDVTGVRPASPLSTLAAPAPAQQPAAPTQQGVGARQPLAAVVQRHRPSHGEEEEEFGFDLDLNPDL